MSFFFTLTGAYRCGRVVNLGLRPRPRHEIIFNARVALRDSLRKASFNATSAPNIPDSSYAARCPSAARAVRGWASSASTC